MSVTIKSVHRTFKKSQEEDLIVLDDVNLHIKKEEFITIIGPSGCGKSTLLKIIAGLDRKFHGSILIGGQELTGPGIKQGFIFQEHRLFPWLTVEKNIAADLSLNDSEIRRKVDELIEIVRLKGFEKAYPRELSGGMAQRVAIARALLRNPDVLLLDEPFGALDAFTRTHLQDVLLDIWKKKKTTMILVTHDLDESIYLANRLVIMTPRPGRISQIIEIDMPYPRKKTDVRFQAIRQQVLTEFEKSELIH
ncbi:sulfonate transport system ATP-binding protein [Peribacillus deserti]|uniref:Sulfonate transport system ATP-binding protein n=1 Tax=Peribacillus deserti TaxID=673318 RepID=A0ABS2QEJ5_9BACI|nr:ABC transporter ATP-binding protein [Peribacillus deserti]MBM7691561.1 sulfonate transport system ATP-binding protein [Peribacillus deserti]